MKKFLTTGILALTLAALSTQDAPAWLNWKFGVGMNMGWQSGGNNTLWGLFRNGQPPAPDMCCGGGPGGVLPPSYGPGPAPAPVPPPPSGLYPSSLEHSVNAADVQAQLGRTNSFTPGQNYYNQMVNYTYHSNPYNYGYGFGR